MESIMRTEKRFLILETNYKIYAYTCTCFWTGLMRIMDRRRSECPKADPGIANELEIAILNLFVDIRIRYPNLVVGKLDRAHVKSAMEKGISAAQIISYLQSHAHGQMHNSVSST